MNIIDITSFIGARRMGTREMNIAWLLTDSRSLTFPETTLFFALTTPRGDGHAYIGDLYRHGVRAFVVSHVPEGDYAEANFLVVGDTLKALQRLSERRREEFDIPVVGITGSNGKTTVKEWLYQMLHDDHVVARSPRSYNSQTGVPLSVWNLQDNSEVGVFEAAISEPGEMEALQRIIQPTIGVLTCLGPAHQENFRSMEQKCREKLLLFKDAETLIYIKGDVVVDRCIAEMQFAGRLVGLDCKGDPLEQDVALCKAVCRELGMDAATADERASHLTPVAMRLEVKDGQHGCTLINDSYNSDLGSLHIALDFMMRRPEAAKKGHTVILSDIEQSGMEPSELYGQVWQLISKRGVSHFIGIGPQLLAWGGNPLNQLWAEDRTDTAQTRSQFFSSTEEFMKSPAFAALRDEVILVKGARSFHFENIVERLERRVHETILEVNLQAVVDNLNYYRSFMKPETKVVCMVKAGAYGAGSVEVARTLQDQGVAYLAVAVADEGVELRKAGITAGIIIMNPEMTSFRTLFRYKLEPEVYSFRLLDALVSEARREGITNFPVHIKLDTGMHRLGFDPMCDMPALIERLHHQMAVIPRSVFSHFVGSDSDDFDRFSQLQFDRFLHGSQLLQAAFQHKILRHMCNSAGIEHFPERHMDMVRLGLGLYGINSRNNEMLHNVSTLKTTILQIHDVPKEETVGYSRKGHLTRDSRIAAIPIGYADGLDRHLGNGHAYCLVNGRKAPYVGNICMDVCMIDVTDIPCAEGDTVIIFGEQLPPTVLSDITETIPYEILTSVSQRVKRVYYKE